MGNSENITAYFADVAQRHPDIQDDPAAEYENRRFFEFEWDEMMQNAGALSLAGWTLILEDYDQRFKDAAIDYINETPVISFMVLKAVEPGDEAVKRATFLQAEQIVRSIVGKMKADEIDPCNADVPDGVIPPRLADINTLSIIRVQPGIFVHVNGTGARGSIMWRTDHEATFNRGMVAWIPRE